MNIARLAAIAFIALAIATPGSAQFGGLKKKIKKASGQEDQSRADAKAAGAPADPAGQGGTVVLTSDVVAQLLTGLKAGKAERAAAAKEDTPYGRFKKAEIAYTEAQPKCEVEKQAFIQKASANPKLMDKVNALNQKMLEAQSQHDYKRMQIYQDSSMAMQGGPSCIVKKPEQPEGYYEGEREVEVRAEKAEVKASALGAGEYAMAKERTIAILGSPTPPADASASEKSAVSAKAAELKPLLGFPEPAVQAVKPEPAPAAAPAAAAAPAVDPQTSAAAAKMGNCMAKNIQAHQAEVEALGKRAQAAQKAKDNATLMAIADTMQQIQMAGCMGR
jgi:hypothetical protein